MQNSLGKIKMRQPIKVRVNNEVIETTVGRLMVNEKLPKGFEFVNKAIKASDIKTMVTAAMKESSVDEVAGLIDSMKNLGFLWSNNFRSFSISF